MTAINERVRMPRISEDPPAVRRRRRILRRHEDAVIQAEVRRLARALSPYRVLEVSRSQRLPDES